MDWLCLKFIFYKRIVLELKFTIPCRIFNITQITFVVSC